MKTKQRPGVVDAKTQRLNARIGVDAYERLLLHAIKARKSPGDLITELIETHLRQWRVQENPTSRGKNLDRLEIDGPVMISEPPAPLAMAS